MEQVIEIHEIIKDMGGYKCVETYIHYDWIYKEAKTHRGKSIKNGDNLEIYDNDWSFEAIDPFIAKHKIDNGHSYDFKQLHDFDYQIKNNKQQECIENLEKNKYKIAKILNNIHVDNNCMGNIIKDGQCCECNLYKDWGTCGKSVTKHFKCDKCDFKY